MEGGISAPRCWGAFTIKQRAEERTGEKSEAEQRTELLDPDAERSDDEESVSYVWGVVEMPL